MERKNPLAIVTDLHGDPHAALRSLAKADVITYDTTTHIWDIKESAHDTIITILGDGCDRGLDTLGVFAVIAKLREKLKVQVLGGNHELLALGALTGNEQAERTWAWNGGIEFYNEIMGKLGITNITFSVKERALAYAYLQENHGDFLSSLQVIHTQDDILCVHSGSIRGKWEKIIQDGGPDAANKTFAEMIQDTDHLRSKESMEMASPDEPYTFAAPFWAREEDLSSALINESSARILKSLGTNLIIHGHSKTKRAPYVRECKVGGDRYNILNMDAFISNGYRHHDAGWCYAKIDTNGHLHAESDFGNVVDMDLNQ